MEQLCKKVLGISNWKKSLFSKKGMRLGSGPLQVIEFPNALQRTLKLYVDWDKKLSDVRSRTLFLDESENSMMQRRSDVERIRQLAMGTPSAVTRLLKKLGCSITGSGSSSIIIRVVVKEGTRPLSVSQEDWKISFHFIFQITVSSIQFRLVYHHMAELIRSSLDNLAAALGLADGQIGGYETAAMKDPLFGALVGMDLHPRQNVYQVHMDILPIPLSLSA